LILLFIIYFLNQGRTKQLLNTGIHETSHGRVNWTFSKPKRQSPIHYPFLKVLCVTRMDLLA